MQIELREESSEEEAKNLPQRKQIGGLKRTGEDFKPRNISSSKNQKVHKKSAKKSKICPMKVVITQKILIIQINMKVQNLVNKNQINPHQMRMIMKKKLRMIMRMRTRTNKKKSPRVK